jgi:hypothetical protein
MGADGQSFPSLTRNAATESGGGYEVATGSFQPRLKPYPWTPRACLFGVSESAGINRLETENERVLQRKLSQSLWPRTLRWEQ